MPELWIRGGWPTPSPLRATTRRRGPRDVGVTMSGGTLQAAGPSPTAGSGARQHITTLPPWAESDGFRLAIAMIMSAGSAYLWGHRLGVAHLDGTWWRLLPFPILPAIAVASPSLGLLFLALLTSGQTAQLSPGTAPLIVAFAVAAVLVLHIVSRWRSVDRRLGLAILLLMAATGSILPVAMLVLARLNRRQTFAVGLTGVVLSQLTRSSMGLLAFIHRPINPAVGIRTLSALLKSGFFQQVELSSLHAMLPIPTLVVAGLVLAVVWALTEFVPDDLLWQFALVTGALVVSAAVAAAFGLSVVGGWIDWSFALATLAVGAIALTTRRFQQRQT